MPAPTVEIVSGNNQKQQRLLTASGIPMANFGPLAIRVTSNGAPVPNQTVTWTSTSHPASMAVQMEPSGALPCTTTTGPDGVTTLNKMGGSSISAYYADGGFTITAACDGASVTFAQTVEGLAPPTLNFTILSGNYQSVARTGMQVPGGFATFAPLQVRLTDAAGKPVPNAQVFFKTGSSPSGMAVQLVPAGGSSAVAFTDANGVATLSQMGGHSASCYYAQGGFTVVANANNAPTATFSLTVAPTPPPPAPTAGATLTLQSGDKQSQPRISTTGGIAMANFAALTVQLKGPDGAPLPGQQVIWSSPSHPSNMAVQMEPSGASPCITLTDSNGNTTLNKMGGSSITCYYADGAYSVNASYGTATATFGMTVGGAAPQLGTATILSGNNQQAARAGNTVPGGMANFGPLQVKLTDPSGHPAAGVLVGFAPGAHPSQMAVQLEPAGSASTVLTADANGIATLNHMGGHSATCYYAAGAFTIIASPTGMSPVTFSMNVSS